MICLGIDPGLHGAIAALNVSDGSLAVMDMPTIPGSKGGNEIDLVALFDLLRPPTDSQVMAAVELVHAMSKDGVGRAFRFGEGYGALKMALAAHRIPRQFITPAKWKQHFRLVKDKGVSRGLAIQRFPDHADLFARVKDDGRAEAALIALYAQEKLLP